jgi:hypothetical protein
MVSTADELVAWIDRNNFPAIGFRNASVERVPGMRAGVVATENMQAGDAFVRYPLSLALHSGMLEDEGTVGHAYVQVLKKRLGLGARPKPARRRALERHGLSFILLVEASRGMRSAYAPYIAALPGLPAAGLASFCSADQANDPRTCDASSDNDDEALHLTWYWSKRELSALEGTLALEETQKMRVDLETKWHSMRRMDWTTVFPPDASSDAQDFGVFLTRERLQWAESMVHSRAIPLQALEGSGGTPVLAMLPLVDMENCDEARINSSYFLLRETLPFSNHNLLLFVSYRVPLFLSTHTRSHFLTV